MTLPPPGIKELFHPQALKEIDIKRTGAIDQNLSAKAPGPARFYNGPGTAEQWIESGLCLNTTQIPFHIIGTGCPQPVLGCG